MMSEVLAFAYMLVGVYIALEDMPPDRAAIEAMLNVKLSAGDIVFLFVALLFIALFWVPILVWEAIARESRRNG